MSDIKKIVDKNLPSPYRTVGFTQSDVSDGDIVDVYGSLGRAAKNCTVKVGDTGDGVSIRFNVKRTVYPRIPRREGFMYVDHLPYLPSGQDYTDDSVATVTIEPGEIFEWETGPAIKDIEIVASSGTWDLWLS